MCEVRDPYNVILPESEVLQPGTAHLAYGNEIPTDICRFTAYKSYEKSNFGDVLMSYNKRKSRSSTIPSLWIMRGDFWPYFKKA